MSKTNMNAGINYLESLAEWKGTPNFNLDNMVKIMDCLGNPQDKIKTVIVAGTNGKGSVSASIASILGAAGYRVGLNISPHLSVLNERIVIDGEPASNQIISGYALRVKQACEDCDIKLSFHEGITAISYLTFFHEKLDFAVMEVGLGGRLDASNVVKCPVAAAIVTIDYDHEHILGNTLEKIAFEKAGVIKSDSLVVTGNISASPLNVISDKAISENARHLSFKKDFSVKKQDGTQENYFEYEGKSENFTFNLSLPGDHQAANAAIAITIGLELGLSKEQCKHGIENVFWPGRLESFDYHGRKVLVDCAHNPAGIEALISYLKARDLKNFEIAFGVLNTKNWEPMMESLRPFVKKWNVLTPEAPHAVPSKIISDHLSRIGIINEDYDKDYARFIADIGVGGSLPLLLTGSIYLIGKLRGKMLPEIRKLWTRR